MSRRRRRPRKPAQSTTTETNKPETAASGPEAANPASEPKPAPGQKAEQNAKQQSKSEGGQSQPKAKSEGGQSQPKAKSEAGQSQEQAKSEAGQSQEQAKSEAGQSQEQAKSGSQPAKRRRRPGAPRARSRQLSPEQQARKPKPMAPQDVANRSPVELYFDLGVFQYRCAVVQDGQIIYVEIEQDDLRLPSIFKAKVRDLVPGMKAAFVDIGLERNAYLYGDDVIIPKSKMKYRHQIDKILKQDQYIMVQITKRALEDKGHRVSTRISLAGRYAVLLPNGSHLAISKQITQQSERERLRTIVKDILPEEMGAIIRTAAVGVSQKALEDDIQELIESWNEIQDRYRRKRSPGEVYTPEPFVRRVVREFLGWNIAKVVVNTSEGYKSVSTLASEKIPELKDKIEHYRKKRPIFLAHKIDDQVEASGQERVYLKSGGNIIIREIEFLTAMDVNTGSYVGHRDFQKTIMKTNLEAAEEVARQVMLRNLAGMILVDFIHLKDDKSWDELRDALRGHFRTDRLKVDVDILRDAGIVVVTRKKRGLALGEYLNAECEQCLGKGRIPSFYAAGTALETALKSAADRPCIVRGNFAFLSEMLFSNQAFADALKKTRRSAIRFRVDDALRYDKFAVESIKSGSLAQMPKAGDRIAIYRTGPHPSIPELAVGVYDGWLVEIKPLGDEFPACAEAVVVEDRTMYLTAEQAPEQ